jgi:hypothetical protein
MYSPNKNNPGRKQKLRPALFLIDAENLKGIVAKKKTPRGYQ